MVSHLKNRIVTKLIQSRQDPRFIRFEKEGEKYILIFFDTNLKIIVSKECVDFFVDEQSLCLKVSDGVYRFVSVMYIVYKVLPFAFALKRIITKLLQILAKR